MRHCRVQVLVLECGVNLNPCQSAVPVSLPDQRGTSVSCFGRLHALLQKEVQLLLVA